MKLISVNALKVGECLGCDIRSGNGNMLLRQGTLVTDKMIYRLKNVGIYAVYIEDEMYADVQIRPALSSETKSLMIGKMEGMASDIKRGRKIKAEDMKTLGKEIFEEVRIAALEPINMVSTFAVDTPLMLHAVNVAILTAALSYKMNVRPQLAENYVTAALLHDVMLDNLADDGKAPYAHTNKLYDYLKATASFDTTCYMAAAMHHERFDGTGGPRKTVGAQINEGARIIAVADMYDNVVQGLGGYQHLPSYQAIEFLVAQAAAKLDPDIVKVFVSCVAIYPTGATITLNNGLSAAVIGQNSGVPTRPIVRVLSPDPTERIEYNLLTQTTLFVETMAL